MNFYQRANLTFGLGVLIGFEFTITNSPLLGNNNLPITWQTFSWIVFQFLFRTKITIDDHDYFSDANIQSLSSRRLFVDFLLFSGANLCFVIAAVTSLVPEVSYLSFIAGLVFATLWAWIHGIKEKKSNDIVMKWIVINIGYTSMLIWLLFGHIATHGEFAIWLIIAIYLLLDFWESETHNKMPN